MNRYDTNPSLSIKICLMDYSYVNWTKTLRLTTRKLNQPHVASTEHSKIVMYSAKKHIAEIDRFASLRRNTTKQQPTQTISFLIDRKRISGTSLKPHRPIGNNNSPTNLAEIDVFFFVGIFARLGNTQLSKGFKH